MCDGGFRDPGEWGWIDVCAPLYSGTVRWPDNPPVETERTLDVERGDVATVSRLSMGSHADAPLHFVRGGDGMDRMPLDTTIGPVWVIGAENPICVRREEFEHTVLAAVSASCSRRETQPDAGGPGTSRRTSCTSRKGRTSTSWSSGLGPSASVIPRRQGFLEDGVETHQALLGAGLRVIEGLDPSGVELGEHRLVCLPLKVEDGAPAPAILRK